MIDSSRNSNPYQSNTNASIPGVNLDIRQSAEGVVHVPGLRQVSVNNIQDVMQVFAQGSANRATTSTNLNERSSRSHLILSVVVSTLATADAVPTKG